MQINFFEKTEKTSDSPSHIFENNFKKINCVVTAGSNCIKITDNNRTSVLVSYDEVFKLFAKCCYYVNFAFTVVLSDTQHRFLVDKERPFSSSIWNYIPIHLHCEGENKNVLIKNVYGTQEQTLFSID